MAASKGEYFLNYLRAPFASASPVLRVLEKFEASKAKDYGRDGTAWYAIELRDESIAAPDGEASRLAIDNGECPFVIYVGFTNADNDFREEAIYKADRIVRGYRRGLTTIGSATIEIDKVKDVRILRAYSDADPHGIVMIMGTIVYKSF
jgi:hypothetical protein